MTSAIYTETTASVHRISESLTATYGTPSRDELPLGNQADPLDELVYILLTVMTEFGVDGVYATLKRRFPTWDALLRARRSTLARLLQPIGLSEQRADRLRTILARLKREHGRCTLDFLHGVSDEDAEAYLLSLPGVGKKVARCVLMYSLGRDVLPVDAHVLRVSKRLRLLASDVSWTAAHDAIHALVPAEQRYGLHVNLVRLGRDLCRARNPKCGECALLDLVCGGATPEA